MQYLGIFVKKIGHKTMSDNEGEEDSVNSWVTKNKTEKNIQKYAQRMAFSKFIKQAECSEKPGELCCCSIKFSDSRELHRHINKQHQEDIAKLTTEIILKGSRDAKWKVLRSVDKEEPSGDGEEPIHLPQTLHHDDVYPWLPAYKEDASCTGGADEGRILLFYNYRDIKATEHVRDWQEVLCRRLGLTGKVRVSREGLNATVGGSYQATEVYMDSVMCHPLFSHMLKHMFKTSPGGSHHFPGGLRVGVYQEAVPMGVHPDHVTYRDAGVHLTPEEFHEAMEKLQSVEAKDDSVLIDCRNYYESKIGRFDGAVAPDIRKFSYWPEYVDQNPELFQDKQVYMYCTGGIRCERGSAYLKAKGLCKEVYQLEGGIHKYIEKFPEGHFKGKLFVFDDRYAIPANDTVLSECTYCHQPWDDYCPCTSNHCHQLVLSCSHCRHQGLTACCATCQENHKQQCHHEECECTARRPRIPVEKTDAPADASSSVQS